MGMPRGRGPSLLNVATTNTPGRTVEFATPVSKALFSVARTAGASTQCSVRVEIQGPGPSTRWTQLGAAATTVRSTQSGTGFTSTSSTPFTKARLRLITRSTGAGKFTGYLTGV